MRQVKKRARAERSDGRRKSAARGKRSGRPAVSERGTFGRRKRNDVLSLTFARIHWWFGHGRPMLWLTGVLLLGVAVTGIFAGGHVRRGLDAVGHAVDTVVADAGFGIGTVEMNGRHRVQSDEIYKALGFETDESIFAVNLQTARARLLALPWVFDAEVRRQYPNVISVDIVERLPFALWQATDGLDYVVERSGRTITVARRDQFPHLPLLMGDGAPASAPEIVDAIALHRAVSARVQSIQRMSDRRWNLILDGNVAVQLPEDGWQSQLDVLEHLIVDKGVLERDIAVIDLRAKDNIFFVLRNGQKQPTRGNST